MPKLFEGYKSEKEESMMSDDDKRDPPALKIAVLNIAPNEIQEAIRDMEKNMDPLKEYQRLQAEVIWVRYSALLKEGFSPIQALQLCAGSF